MRNSNGNTFSFVPHLCYFSYLPWIAGSKGWSLTTLFSTKMRREKITTKTLPTLSLIPLEFRHSSAILCKKHKKPEVDKKTQACESLTFTEDFVFFSSRWSKLLVSCSLTLNWWEHFIWYANQGCDFPVCSGVRGETFKV